MPTAEGILEIPEVAGLDARGGLVRIPPELDVPLTPRVRRIIDAPQFRRLAKVGQLGLVGLVYPGATHSRFEHALGVYRLALLFLKRLAHDARFAAAVSPRDAERFIAAALLHDIGHWPFCHAMEDLHLPGVPTHEAQAGTLLLEAELADALGEDWDLDPAEAAALLGASAANEERAGGEAARPTSNVQRPTSNSSTSDSSALDVGRWTLDVQSSGVVASSKTPASHILASMLSGPIDIDKMDYLARDSLHAGVPYGRNFDQGRLIGSLCLNEAGDGLALTDKGKTAAEMMVFSRYVMFSEVYWHHGVRAATAMLQRAFYLLHPTLDLQAVFRLDDGALTDRLVQEASKRGAPVAGARELLEGLFGRSRRLYKRVAQFSIFEQSELYERLARRPYPWLAALAERFAALASAELCGPVPPHEILFDAPPQEREVEFRVEVYSPKEDRYRWLEEVSPVVRTLAREQFDDYVKRVRLFAPPSVASRLRVLPTLWRMLDQAIEETERM
jgi:HD superfamily phosphohydrolase